MDAVERVWLLLAWRYDDLEQRALRIVTKSARERRDDVKSLRVLYYGHD